MHHKLLKEIIREIVGENAENLLALLEDKENVNEFFIAKKMNLTINQVRNMFYKLSNFGLVSFSRKKDKRKGWYTYFWTLNSGKTLELLEGRMSKEIKDLKEQLHNRKTKRFYMCNNCKTEIGEEAALLHNFSCQECGEVYTLNEDEKILHLLEARITKLERERQDILQEMCSLNEQKRVKGEKKAKREKAKKARERKKISNKKEKKSKKRK